MGGACVIHTECQSERHVRSPYRLEREQIIGQPRSEGLACFSQPHNLGGLTREAPTQHCGDLSPGRTPTRKVQGS